MRAFGAFVARRSASALASASGICFSARMALPSASAKGVRGGFFSPSCLAFRALRAALWSSNTPASSVGSIDHSNAAHGRWRSRTATLAGSTSAASGLRSNASSGRLR